MKADATKPGAAKPSASGGRASGRADQQLQPAPAAAATPQARPLRSANALTVPATPASDAGDLVGVDVGELRFY